MSKTQLAIAASCLALWALPGHALPVVTSAAGATPADIQASVDAFRAALGANNGAGPAPSAGGLASGRREINWDAAALDAVAAPATMPASQFNGAAAPFARGAVFATPGSGFMISRRIEQGGDAPLFGFAAADVFLQAFSQQRVFAPVGAHQTDTTFAVPGFASVTASVSAFGAVFADVEVNNLSALEFFDLAGQSLGQFYVPASVDGGLSFLGVRFDANERIASVRITTGDINLVSHGVITAGSDFVVLDDFIYAEPVPVPEVGTAGLMALGLGGLAGLAGLRRVARHRRG